jgi:hypothetical protein
MGIIEISIGMFVVGLSALVIEVWLGWDRIISWIIQRRKGEVIARHETDPANVVTHELPDGRVATLLGVSTIRKYEIPELNKVVEFLKCDYEYKGEEFSDVWEKSMIKPVNLEALTNSDGAHFKILLKPEPESELEKRIMELRRKLEVKNTESMLEDEEFDVRLKKFGEKADYLGKKVGKVTVSQRPSEVRREPLTPEGGEMEVG